MARDAIALSVGSAERRSHWENVYATKVEDEASLFRKTRPAAQSRIALRSPKKSRRLTHRRREIETPLGDDALVPQVGLGRSDPPTLRGWWQPEKAPQRLSWSFLPSV